MKRQRVDTLSTRGSVLQLSLLCDVCGSTSVSQTGLSLHRTRARCGLTPQDRSSGMGQACPFADAAGIACQVQMRASHIDKHCLMRHSGLPRPDRVNRGRSEPCRTSSAASADEPPASPSHDASDYGTFDQQYDAPENELDPFRSRDSSSCDADSDSATDGAATEQCLAQNLQAQFNALEESDDDISCDGERRISDILLLDETDDEDCSSGGAPQSETDSQSDDERGAVEPDDSEEQPVENGDTLRDYTSAVTVRLMKELNLSGANKARVLRYLRDPELDLSQLPQTVKSLEQQAESYCARQLKRDPPTLHRSVVDKAAIGLQCMGDKPIHFYTVDVIEAISLALRNYKSAEFTLRAEVQLDDEGDRYAAPRIATRTQIFSSLTALRGLAPVINLSSHVVYSAAMPVSMLAVGATPPLW